MNVVFASQRERLRFLLNLLRLLHSKHCKLVQTGLVSVSSHEMKPTTVESVKRIPEVEN